MASIGYATLDVIPSVRGLRGQLDKQVNPGLVAAGRKGGAQYGAAAGTAAAQGMTSSLKSGLNDFGGTKLLAGLGIAAAGKAIIGLQAEFESSINVLGASADLTSSQMAQMARFAKQMGAETVFSAGEAADAMVELAKAGIAPAAIEAGALKATMAVAATEGLRLADAATIISNAMTTFGIEGGRAVVVADALAGGSKASTASVSSLSEAMSQVGGSAVDAGLSIQETVAALAAFDQQGIKGSDAGTSLKTMLSRLVPQTDKARGAMRNLGLEFTDATGQFVPLADIADQLQKKMSGLSDAERTAALNTIFGSDARRAALALMNEGRKGIEGFTKATSEAGVASKLADARMSGTAGAIERLKGSIETAGLAFGEVLAPAVVVTANGIGGLADAVASLPAPVQAATLAFVGLKAASALGFSGPTASIGSLSGALDGMRLKTMFAADAFREARRGSVILEGQGFRKLSAGAGRVSASMKALGTITAGAGRAMTRGLGGAINMLGGPWGLALIAGAAALTKFKQGQAEAKARVESLTETLDAQTGALTKSSRANIVSALENEGAFKAAREFGIGLELLTDAASGNGFAIREVNKQIQAYIDLQPKGTQVNNTNAQSTQNVIDHADKLRSALNDQNSEVGKSRQSWLDQAEAMGESDKVSGAAAEGMRDYASEIDKAAGKINELVTAEKDRALAAIQSKRDAIALRETIRAAREEANKGKRVLDDGTKAADANMTALLNLADQWANTKNSVKNSKGAYQDVRAEFVKLADQMNGPGGTREAAEKLADKLLKMPKPVLKYKSEGYKQRLAEIAELKRQMISMTTTIKYPGTSKPVAPLLERASGGPIYGPGTGTSDSILMRGSNGEFMQRKKAVDYYGMDFMHRLNNMQIPKFATGGPIGQAPAARVSTGGGNHFSGPITVVADTYEETMRKIGQHAIRAGSDGVRSR